MNIRALRVMRLRYREPTDELLLDGFRTLLCDTTLEPPKLILADAEAREVRRAASKHPARLEVLSEGSAGLRDAYRALDLNALRWTSDPERALPLPTVEDLVRHLARDPGQGRSP